MRKPVRIYRLICDPHQKGYQLELLPFHCSDYKVYRTFGPVVLGQSLFPEHYYWDLDCGNAEELLQSLKKMQASGIPLDRVELLLPGGHWFRHMFYCRVDHQHAGTERNLAFYSQ